MRRLLHTTTEINIVFNFCPNRDTIGESIGGEDMFVLRFDVESAYALHPSMESDENWRIWLEETLASVETDYAGFEAV